jgi:isovaleryl-CoA dehydrogenase
MGNMSNDTLEAVRVTASRFMEKEVAPAMDGFEKRGEFPRDLIRKAGELGLYGAVFPEWVGGTDLGYFAAAIITEEMARIDVRFSACNNQQGSTCPTCIFSAGTDEQVMKYVPKLLAGENIGMMSLTEAGGGSDPVGNMRTFAKRDGDVYKLNGSKMFASMANQVDSGVLLAKTDPSAGHRGITAFIVEPKKYPGFDAKPINTAGLSKALRTCAVFLDDFVVPVENRLGEEGEGMQIVMNALQSGRITVAAKAVGVAQACVDEAVRYLKERNVRGAPLGTYQMIQADLADMIAQLSASRLLVYEAARLMDEGKPSNKAAAIAKYHASVTAKLCADKTQQFFGGYGLTDEYRISWLKAYADLFFTGEGSANVQRILIAEDALGIKVADRHAGKVRFRSPRTATAPAGIPV